MKYEETSYNSDDNTSHSSNQDLPHSPKSYDYYRNMDNLNNTKSFGDNTDQNNKTNNSTQNTINYQDNDMHSTEHSDANATPNSATGEHFEQQSPHAMQNEFPSHDLHDELRQVSDETHSFSDLRTTTLQDNNYLVQQSHIHEHSTDTANTVGNTAQSTYIPPSWDEIANQQHSPHTYGNTQSQRRRNTINSRHRTSAVWQVLGILAELLLIAAFVCGMYIVWQMWWTGVQAEQAQEKTLQTVSWSQPSHTHTSIAKPQSGTAPKLPKPGKNGTLLAQIFIPRFGSQWNRNIVQGVDIADLNLHGLGHYTNTQMPGQLGNFALAGHRNGYGQPLGDVDKLQPGDPIIIRSKDYWYVYKFTHYKIVKPDQVYVISPNPDHPREPATEHLITLTTCEPKYSTPIYRWISWGKLSYWAKVSDGIPQELATKDSSGQVKFINNETPSWAAKSIRSLTDIMLWLFIAYVIIFITAAFVWKWPKIHAIRSGEQSKPEASIFGTFLRYQPGPAIIRGILGLIVVAIISLALLQWGYPWAASHIPALHQLSNYVTE